MFRSARLGVIASVAIVLGIAGLFYSLAGAAAAPADKNAGLEFTADGKLKQPMIAPVASHSAPPDDRPAGNSEKFSPYVTKDGAISRPTNYREAFLHLGTYAVASKPNKPIDEMHNVYARPEDVRAFQRDGHFPDGAALVKEVTSVGSEKLTTGQADWSTDVKLWFVLIKDSKGRFPGNDLWGDGWGWALFMANEPARNVATDYKTDCKTCHLPAKNDDWIYLRGYPMLKDRKKADSK